MLSFQFFVRKTGLGLALLTTALTAGSNEPVLGDAPQLLEEVGTYAAIDPEVAKSIADGEPILLYSTDFGGAVGTEWSVDRISNTPVGARRFLGQFGSETVTLTLNAVPPHGYVIVVFDLFIIGSWDGNYVSPSAGPDIWDLSSGNDLNHLHTTFNTHTFAGQYQAYPDNYPGGSHAPLTGASEVGTLGYPCAGSCVDSVYHLELFVDDSNNNLVLDFSASNLESLSNESWGLDNVTVFIEGTAADFDHDWDVDLEDFLAFWLCYNGPDKPPRVWCPVDADFDDNGHVDQADLQYIQECFGGADAAPSCFSE